MTRLTIFICLAVFLLWVRQSNSESTVQGASQQTDDELFAEPTRIIHKFIGEAAGDQFGWTARRAGDWDKDGVIDFVATAPKIIFAATSQRNTL